MRKVILLNYMIVLMLLITGCTSDKNVEDLSETEEFQIVTGQASYEYDISDMSVVAEVFSNIFIAEIEKVVETRPYENQEWGSHIPYTVYKIKVLENIKGDADSSSMIIYYGGVDYIEEIIYLPGVSEMPIIGGVYLFTVNDVIDSRNERDSDVDYRVAWAPAEMFLILDYNTSKNILNQSDTVKELLEEYQIAVEVYEKNKNK